MTAGARAIDCLINSSEGQKISVRLKRFVKKCNVQIVAIQRQMLSSAKAFSVAEAMIAVLIASIVLGMSAPMISRQLKRNNMNDVQFQVLNKKIEQLRNKSFKAIQPKEKHQYFKEAQELEKVLNEKFK